MGDGLQIKVFADNTFSGERNNQLQIGDEVFVKIEWAVQTLQQNVRFFVKDCQVEDELHSETNGNSIHIIKNSCYASAFNAKLHGDKTVQNEAFYSYRTFS